VNNHLADYIPPGVLRLAERIVGDRRGAVTMIYAILIGVMLITLGVGLDGSNAVETKYRLDLAADAGAVACGETWQSSLQAQVNAQIAGTDTGTYTQALTGANGLAQKAGAAAFLAQAGSLEPILTGAPHVTATNGVTPGANGATVKCEVTYTANSPTYLMKLAGINFLQVTNFSVSNVELAPFTNVYLVLDTSASMMVGSTPADQGKIAAWVASHPSAVFNPLTGNDNSPCAFACHEEASGFQEPPIDLMAMDVQAGETNAHKALATTRFDVAQQALVNDPVTQSYCSTASTPPAGTVACNLSQSEGLLPFIRDTFDVANARANLNTFSYGVYGFNEGFMGYTGVPVANNTKNPTITDVVDSSQFYSRYPTSTASNPLLWPSANLANVVSDIGTLTIGFDTHFNDPVYPGQTSVGRALVNFVAPTAIPSSPAPGTTSTNPQKFVILMTDGMNSDRNWNFGGFSSSHTSVPSNSNDTPNTITYLSGNDCGVWSTECNNSSYIPIWPSPNNWTGGNPTTTWNGNYKVGYGGPFDTSFCTTLKQNGVTIAVLETPYQPLNAQDPHFFPYEGTVQHTMFPGGSGSQNMVSEALQNCASPGFYFQATDDTQIATGFITLFNTFVGQFVHITQ
jgi:Flp pilus assembly protein TadG